MKRTANLIILIFLSITTITETQAQLSVAREWNEKLLIGIRGDRARPTVHARNLFHISMGMYDAWAVYDDTAETYFLGKMVNRYVCPFDGIDMPTDRKAAQEEAITYVAFRLINKRFENSPGRFITLNNTLDLMDELGFDPDFTSTDYSTGSPAALGNYIAEQIITYGNADGSNELNSFFNQYYETTNQPLEINGSGNMTISDPNRWQPLTLLEFIDQSGNPEQGNTPDFLSPEWGNVSPFAMKPTDATIYERDGNEYKVFNDPGKPPFLETENTEAYLPDEYKWGFAMVSVWGAHLSPDDSVMIDISPASIGNNPALPTEFEDYRSFYDFINGGDASQGHSINPKTGQPYTPQIVPRADYARVLAEFWADGPDSETPPGHWFSVLNYVTDHPDLVKKFKGEGEIIDDLEWDVKSYFMLGGAMHDAAISAWSIKGWYDYIRPVSAIRYMAGQGQSTDENLPNYSPHGIPLVEGYIEIIEEGDPDFTSVEVGKIKLYTWRGPNYILDPQVSTAGVGWILADDFWPFQRPSFVTPPFAGYISGHSTFSRAAAEVLTMFTGDPFFPGGVGTFFAEKNEFLVFENGPSVDITLEWATYRDASDQTSLSRIWGGIHPPADDIPGRLIGEKVGIEAFNFAEQYFEGNATETLPLVEEELVIYPNPILTNSAFITVGLNETATNLTVELFDTQGRLLLSEQKTTSEEVPFFNVFINNLNSGLYILSVTGDDWVKTGKVIVGQR